MKFDGEFRVPGSPDEVIQRFAMVEKMVHCMPGASIEGQDAEGKYLCAMTVALGPKKIRFRGKATSEVDLTARTGRQFGKGAAEMKVPARIDVDLHYTVRQDPSADTPTSIVTLSSETQLSGVLAEFGRTGATALAKSLMDAFAKRVAAEFGRSPTSVSNPPTAGVTTKGRTNELSAIRLVWAALVEKVRKLGKGLTSR